MISRAESLLRQYRRIGEEPPRMCATCASCRVHPEESSIGVCGRCLDPRESDGDVWWVEPEGDGMDCDDWETP